MKKFYHALVLALMIINGYSQNYNFNFNTSGRRVCLVSTKVDLNAENVKVIFHDSLSNTTESINVFKRTLGSQSWTSVASNLSPGTGHWYDTNVNIGEIWEYQVKRQNTWTYLGSTYDAIGYTIGALLNDNTNYKGQMILLVSDDIPTFQFLSEKYIRLKKEITNDGWFVNELIVPRATSWDSGNEVVTIKNQIMSIYNNAPPTDKPKAIFILGHVPLPRSGSTNIVSPDDHFENTGARGSDSYYADIDGVYTDNASYNPGGLGTSLAINIPNDSKWDQDFLPSDLEMAFGRIDFEDITDLPFSEFGMIEQYLDRLSAYRNVVAGSNMGDKSAFYFGYDNSNDASFRNLANISSPENLYQNFTGPNHNQWVQNNGPFKFYMQNIVEPEISHWETFGMDATVYSSDQSYWGFGDVPQPAPGSMSKIRTLLGIESKCLIALWTTSAINIFHQACTGEPLGISMKSIMNHSLTNQIYEKPAQEYDEADWWNRTHYAFYGDPTLNLYQIEPVSNLILSDTNGSAVLDWDASQNSEIIGYHIYESDSEFGVFNRVTTSTIIENTYAINNYQMGNWYMVKAVKIVESGCGQFLHPSLGISIEGSLTLGVDKQITSDTITIYPNPSSDVFNLKSGKDISSLSITSLTGTVILNRNLNSKAFSINLKNFASGIYIVKMQTSKGGIYYKKIIKR